MKAKFITYYFAILFLSYSMCYAQFETPGDSQGLFYTSLGGSFYSRTLQGEDSEENIQQWMFPLLAKGFALKNVNIMMYQTASYSKLDNAELSGLENTLLRASLNLFDDAFTTYLGFRIPIIKVEPETETARLDSLIYNEVLQFGVKRLTEGFDIDAGFGLTHTFGNFALGIGAGYIIRGSYDRLSQSGDIASYNPGDTLSGTTGFRLRTGIISLGGGLLYLYSGDDTMDDVEVFRSGDEISLYSSARFNIKPVIITVFIKDTLKSESDTVQETIITNNLFDNRLNGAISVSYPFLGDTLILNTRTSTLFYFRDGIESRNLYFEGGFRLFITNDIALKLSSGFILGQMDSGDTDISGFNIGLRIGYGF